MPINTHETMNVLTQLSEIENLQVTVSSAGKSAAFIGLCAFGGALLGGPVGLGIGGTLSSLFTAFSTSGQYKSLADILMNDLTITQKQRLANSVNSIVNQLDATDALQLVAILMGNDQIKRTLLESVANFLRREMSLELRI